MLRRQGCLKYCRLGVVGVGVERVRDDSVVAVASLMTTRQESSHSGVFPFLISDSRAWKEQEGVEANHNHEMTASSQSHLRNGSGSGGENRTFGRPMMFMHCSSLPAVASAVATSAAVTTSFASASHLGREDNSGLDVGVPFDQGRRFVEGPGISSGDDAMSEAVKHHNGGDDGDGNMGQSHGIRIGIPWDRSRLHERYGMLRVGVVQVMG